MTAHKHAELMLQYAQDAAETEEPWLRWEVRSNSKDPWRSGSRRICFDSTCEYRRKPRTMTYTITIQEPTREAPEVGEKYYYSGLIDEELYGCTEWDGAPIELRLLKRGLCFATKEDAIAAAKAMLPIKDEA